MGNPQQEQGDTHAHRGIKNNSRENEKESKSRNAKKIYIQKHLNKKNHNKSKSKPIERKHQQVKR